MDQSNTLSRRFAFHGNGSALFGQFLVNALLTVVTLGFYYPWAKAKMTRYYYGETEFAGSRFQFHGTGREMFVGFLKTLLGLIGLGVIAALIGWAVHPIAGALAFYLTLIGLIPFAVVESMRYTCAKSSWRGIYFHYHGRTGDMARVYLPGLLLTLITFGRYAAWFLVSINREITNNTRFGGKIVFEYEGKGGELFGKILKGYLLSIITLGIYGFWLAADLYNYHYNHTYIRQEHRLAHFHATVTGGQLLKMFVVDLLLLVFTLGLAYPWVVVKNLRYQASQLSVEGDLNLEAIQPGEAQYVTATGEAFTSVMS